MDETIEALCKFGGCTRRARARGWCERHYGQVRLYGKPFITKYDPNEIIINENGNGCCAKVILRNKNGDAVAAAQILTDDINKIEGMKWSAYYSHKGKPGEKIYARNAKNRIKMENYLVGISHSRTLVVDHLNGDSLDNRRLNLRVVSNIINALNRKIARNNTSGITGVYKHGKKWIAGISVCDTGSPYLVWSGVKETKEEAATERKEMEKKYWGYW